RVTIGRAVTEVLYSRSMLDEKRVEPLLQALREKGLSVSPTKVAPIPIRIDSLDTAQWALDRIRDTDCVVIVFWTTFSVLDETIRKEETLANQLDKLISVQIGSLDDKRIPNGINLAGAAKFDWDGKYDDKLLRSFHYQVISKIDAMKAMQARLSV